jgi:hypothetical protein
LQNLALLTVAISPLYLYLSLTFMTEISAGAWDSSVRFFGCGSSGGFARKCPVR